MVLKLARGGGAPRGTDLKLHSEFKSMVMERERQRWNLSEKLCSDAWPLIPINTIKTLTGTIHEIGTNADISAETNAQTVLDTSKTIAVKELRAYTGTADEKHQTTKAGIRKNSGCNDRKLPRAFVQTR